MGTVNTSNVSPPNTLHPTPKPNDNVIHQRQIKPSKPSRITTTDNMDSYEHIINSKSNYSSNWIENYDRDIEENDSEHPEDSKDDENNEDSERSTISNLSTMQSSNGSMANMQKHRCSENEIEQKVESEHKVEHDEDEQYHLDIDNLSVIELLND